MRFLKRILITALVLIAWAQLFPNQFSIINWQTAVVAAVVLGFLNGIVGPILKILSFPITILTLGLWLFVLNALLLLAMTHFVLGIFISGFGAALLLSLALSAANAAFGE